MSVSVSQNSIAIDNSETKLGLKSSELTRILETQKSSNKLLIPDLFFGDDGAFEIAKFIQENKHFVNIELRGNNISALGFEAICESLKGSTSLKKISAEWNNIGSENLGIIALNEFMQSNNTVLSLDLRNNHIGPSCAGAIANIIRDSSSLKIFDLRWNELGDEGAKLILLALKDHPGKVQVDLTGNKISHEVLMELDLVNTERTTQKVNKPSSSIRESNRQSEISQSHKSTPHTPQRVILSNKENLRTENTSTEDYSYAIAHDNSINSGRTVFQPISNLNISPLGRKTNLYQASNSVLKPLQNFTLPTLSSNRSQMLTSMIGSYNPENDIQQIKERYLNETKEIEEKCNNHIQMHMKMATLVTNLERRIEEERNKNEIKETKIQELTTNLNFELEKRQELELNYNQLLAELQQRDHHVGELSLEAEQLRNENIQMRRLIEELKDGNVEIHKDFQRKMSDVDKRYKDDVAILTTNNDELRIHIEKIQNDFNQQMHAIHIANEENIKLYEEKVNNAIMATTELAEELKKKQNEIEILQAEHIEDVRKAFEQGKTEEFQKAQKAMFDFDQELRLLQNENEQLKQKSENLLKDLEQLNKQKQIQQRQFEDQVNRSNEEKYKLENELQVKSHSIESQKDELDQRKSLISKLEAENSSMKLEFIKLKEDQNEYIEKLKRNNEIELKKAENNKDNLKRKITELEIELKEAKDETQRITEEYNKLGDMLKGNISKLISQTFNEHEKLKTPNKLSGNSQY